MSMAQSDHDEELSFDDWLYYDILHDYNYPGSDYRIDLSLTEPKPLQLAFIKNGEKSPAYFG